MNSTHCRTMLWCRCFRCCRCTYKNYVCVQYSGKKLAEVAESKWNQSFSDENETFEPFSTAEKHRWLNYVIDECCCVTRLHTLQTVAVRYDKLYMAGDVTVATDKIKSQCLITSLRLLSLSEILHGTELFPASLRQWPLAELVCKDLVAVYKSPKQNIITSGIILVSSE